VTGVDEWQYTSYCCVDTYFGKESGHGAYFHPPTLMEPASGGLKELKYPLWNPRDYFLCILSIRIDETVWESLALINSFEERMEEYVRESDRVNYLRDADIIL
jgi:hypothetical protein